MAAPQATASRRGLRENTVRVRGVVGMHMRRGRGSQRGSHPRAWAWTLAITGADRIDRGAARRRLATFWRRVAEPLGPHKKSKTVDENAPDAGEPGHSLGAADQQRGRLSMRRLKRLLLCLEDSHWAVDLGSLHATFLRFIEGFSVQPEACAGAISGPRKRLGEPNRRHCGPATP